MFRQAAPVALPVIACYYHTDGPQRVSDRPGRPAAVATVRSLASADRPMRILVHTDQYPVISETYIGEDINRLRGAGAEVVVTANKKAVSSDHDTTPVRLDFERVIHEFAPDVVLVHWANHAESILPLLRRHDLPFACRSHSFDFETARVARLMSDPLCVGLYCNPTDTTEAPPGAVAMLPVVGPWTDLPPWAPAIERRTVMSASACLPKKDMRLLIEAMASLPGLDRQIVLGRTNDFEGLPEEVARMAAAGDPAIKVVVDLPRAEVLARLTTSAALLYVLTPQSRMGWPMSIIEAMLCGAIPITPERSSARELVGPTLRTYRQADDIVAHVLEIVAGGPSVDDERSSLRERAERHRHPDEVGRLHEQLRQDLLAWRARSDNHG
jgi:glycosyltransferase involved in cell wall biosynthesis